MKFAIAFIFLFVLVPSTPAPSRNVSAPDSPFDTYRDICFEDEKARLDNFAFVLRENPGWVGYIVVYSGNQSCAGEASYRGNRAKKWVVSRGIEADRVIVKDGGYQAEVFTRLQPWPKDKTYAELPGLLARSEVKVYKRCRSKMFRPTKCPKSIGRA